MIVAIIPARGGSKRIPGKNIRPFAGRPMLHYAVETALNTGIFDQVVVSTDCAEIAREARKAGADVPFVRPDRLADDHTITTDVLRHALSEIEKTEVARTFCCLYPATPLLDPKTLVEAFRELQETNAPCVFPVTTFPSPVHRGFLRKADGTAQMMWPEHMNTRSNDLPEVWHDAGQFYFYDRDAFIANPALYLEGARTIALPRQMVQDIDTEEDWQMAECLYAALRNGGDVSRTVLAS